MTKESRKAIFIIFVIVILCFLFWNVHRAGLLQREHDSIIASADSLISKSEASLARWNHGVGR